MREENQFSVLRFNPALQAFPPSHLGIVCKHPLPTGCRRFRFPFSVLRFPFSVLCLFDSSYVLLPSPSRAESIIERTLCLPAELLVCVSCICPNHHNITRTAWCNLVVELQLIYTLEGIYQLQYRYCTTRANIEDFVILLALIVNHSLDSHHVSLCQIHYIDVVTQARAIRGVVVVTEYREALTNTCCGLGDEWYEVLRYTTRQLADKCRWVSTD